MLALGALLLACMSSSATAQDRVAIGSGPWAMPALHRVMVASENETGVDAAALTGYGYTEDVLGRGDSHHRALGSVAIAGRPLSWLTIAGRVDGRWDHHLLGGVDDQSAVGEARLALRGDFAVARGLALGLASIVLVPGSSAPSLVFDATTVDARGLLAWTPEGTPITLALDLGFRFDRTARAAPRPIPYGQADLVSLGASDSDALLLGAGVVARIDETELFGEVTADLLVEQGLAGSPVRVAVGTRVPLVSRLLSLHAAIEGGLGGRTAVNALATLVPVEPRIAIMVGIVLSPRSASAVAPEIEPEIEPAPEPIASDARRVVRGRVLDPSGTPITGARVHLADAAEPTATTASDGTFTLEGVPAGAALVLDADGYEPQTFTEGAAGTDIVLARALPEGALRGLVRSLSGHALTATIRVEPSATTAQTDADGAFELALPPGHYDITIEAHGLITQHRAVDVEVGGVTVINVDLRAAH